MICGFIDILLNLDVIDPSANIAFRRSCVIVRFDDLDLVNCEISLLHND